MLQKKFIPEINSDKRGFSLNPSFLSFPVKIKQHGFKTMEDRPESFIYRSSHGDSEAFIALSFDKTINKFILSYLIWIRLYDL